MSLFFRRSKFLLLSLSFFLLCQKATTQSCPPNLDFELGNFSNWECFTGVTNVSGGQNNIILNPSPPMPGRHEIISATTVPALDRYGLFPQLCPYGSGYSVKLGNELTGAQAEGLSYTFTVPVTIDTFTFTYFYAVVFEDPDHSAFQQPRFFVTAYDVATGDLINCASYNYISDGAIPGFQVSPLRPNVLFKNWTPTSLQFAGLAGRTVRLEFKTADCTLGGHFGYAYIDVASACTNILATAPYCIETNSLILNAPYGFQSYTWYNDTYTSVIGTGQSLTLSPPPATNGIFYVDLIPYPGYGCRDTLQAIVNPLPVPDTPVAASHYSYCQFQSVPALTATALPGNQLLWYTMATGGTGSTIPPIPATAASGIFNYYVSQKVLFGCESFRKKITVNVIPTPVASFIINNNRQCQNGNSFVFTSTSTNRSNSMHTWSFGDGQTFSSTDTFATHTYATAGSFTVKLKVENAGTCFTETTHPIVIIPKPVAAFNYPAVICENQTTVTLTDNSSVQGGVALITNWWWNINSVITTTQNPASFIANVPGLLPITLIVTTAEGCRSDTNNTVLPVRYRPDADFKIGDLLCNNEAIKFTDLSRMPQGASGETITKWNWQFDNTINSSLQNPSLNFIAGMHNASLIAETNFGCKSIQADSLFEIHAKPQIQLDINDSCVFVPIRYNASDLTTNTEKWYWDFGNGLSQGVPLVTKTYNTEGSRPLTLLSQSIEGCKDTLIRPFTIYDNKAFAGKDTVAAMDEPVQLNAKGGSNVVYNWSPSTGLNNPVIENPVAILDRDQLYQLNALTDKGCKRQSQILIKRYKGPELYIPTAFTPNRDGLNDVLKVIPIGISSFGYFAVYNRYGQQVYRTTNYSEGWDGRFKGVQLGTGTFVFIAQAIDYKGKMIFRKGTVTLIR